MAKFISIPVFLLAVSFLLCSGHPTSPEEATEDASKDGDSRKAPKVTYSKDTKVNISEPLSIDCEVKNVDLTGIEGFSIDWSKVLTDKDGNETVIHISTNEKIVIMSDKYTIDHKEGTYGYSLQIKETDESDNGTYRCTVIFGPEQHVKADVPVTILKRAYFSDQTVKTLQVSEGDAISIDCQPGGLPEPDVYWQRVGQELPYYGGQYFLANRFDIPLVHRSHKGHFRCYADNGLGEPATSELIIEVNYKPTVELSSETIPASVYEEVFVECVSEGLPVPDVVWHKEGHEVASSANVIINTKTNEETKEVVSTLKILKLELEDFADYECVSSNEVGTEKKSARIQLKTPPNIEKQTTGEKIYQTDDYGRGRNELPIALLCKSSGVPPPTYRWYKDGSLLLWQSDPRMSLEFGSGTLLIQKPNRLDNGEYQCFAYNEMGVASSDKIILSNETAVEFIREEPGVISYEAIEGKPFRFACPKVIGHPQPELTWMTAKERDGGIEMTPIKNERIVVDDDGTLWISHVTKDDDTEINNFKYQCLALSELHPYDINLAKTVSLKVIEPTNGSFGLESDDINVEPFLMHSSPKEVVFKSNEVNKLWCIFGGEPVPGVIWERGDNKTFDESRFSIQNNGQTLVFNDTQPDDAGIYYCIGSNIVNVTEKTVIKVTVEISPKFTTDFNSQAQIVREGAKVTFACDILGGQEAKVNYEWFFNSRALTIAEGSRRAIEGANLVISSSKITDTGNYACKASNENGYAYGQTTLNVIPSEDPSKASSIDLSAIQDMKRTMIQLSSEVKALQDIVQAQSEDTKVCKSMGDLLNKIAEKVLQQSSQTSAVEGS